MSKAIPDGFLPGQALKEPYNNITMQGTWLASGTVIFPNITFTNGISIQGGLSWWNNIVAQDTAQWFSAADADNKYVAFGAKDNGASTVEVARLAGAADPYFSFGGNGRYRFYYSDAFGISGATSGEVKIAVAAAAGTWTMSLPTGVAGTAGFQLTDANADGVCSWSGAGSLREWKDIIGLHDPQDSLDKILHTRAYDFRFKEGFGTGDTKTRYTGVMADGEDAAPWAMHFNGDVLNPISAFGHTVGAIQAMNTEDWLIEQVRLSARKPEFRELLKQIVGV